MIIIGNRISEIRKANHILQGDLAKKLGIGRTSLSNIENCKYNPSAETMKLISDIFQLPLGDIFFNPDVLRCNTK